jgi:polyhydroxybutyrate depolymerase
MRLTNYYFTWFFRPGRVRRLIVDGRTRSYFVHLPQGHDNRSAMPVVVALHGATMNGPMMAWFSGLDQKADEAGFLAVFPNGTGSWENFFWNAGNGCDPAIQSGVDDVKFIDVLLDDLCRSYPVDQKRIYVAGLSNGAVMAYRLAAELSGRIAAIAAVAGGMGTEVHEVARPVSVLHFHGTCDEFIPILGGVGSRSILRAKHWPIDHSIRTWVKLNGCNESPHIEALSHARDDTQVTRTTYSGGKDGAEVALIVIEGGGHTWPGQPSPVKMLGKSACNISANNLTWEFFQKHPLS